MVSIPVTMLPAAKQATYSLIGDPYDWLIKKEKTRVLFIDGSAYYAGAAQKGAAAALQLLPGTTLYVGVPSLYCDYY